MLPIINLILNCVGLVVIPILIVLGVIRSRTNSKERLKAQIILEMHKSSSQGEKYCHIYKIRDTIFQKRKRFRREFPTLKFLLLFDQALRELDIEKQILRVYEAEVTKEESIPYQSIYSEIMSQYGLIEENTLIYAIIPTYAECDQIIKNRSARDRFWYGR